MLKKNSPQIIDVKPKLDSGKTQHMDQLYTRTISAGMYLGIPIITYTNTFTVTSSKS